MAIILLLLSAWASISCHGKSLIDPSEAGLRVVESDILLPPEDGTNNQYNLHSLKRNAQRNRNFAWRTKVIPYEIAADLSSNTDVILKAMRSIENVSCLSFKQQVNEMIWIKFVPGTGCASYVGKQYWSAGPQDIYLADACMKEDTIIHEVLHSLGFWHEQSRPDRDQNIEILWENIVTGKDHNFDKFDEYQLDYLGTPYDTESIMHYGNYYFSKNGLKTMASLKHSDIELGSKDGLSVLDIVRLNALYSCADDKREYLSSWSDYSPCSEECVKTRQRFCAHVDLTKCLEADGNGIESETKDCARDATECYAPVNGHWGKWSPWNDCSTTCGPGTATRVRMCVNPAPTYGGAECVGNGVDTGSCDVFSCNLDEIGCNFERGGFCQWKNVPSKWYDFKWHVRQGTTKTIGTGPTGDADGILEGHYAYVESSSPAMTGDKALLVSPQFSNLKGMCVKLSYHMYGDRGMGELNVYQKHKDGTQTALWQIKGNQGKQWLNKTMDIQSTQNTFNVVIEAVRGSTFKSDIAVDNIQIVKKPCTEEQWNYEPVGCYHSYFNSNYSKIFPSYKDYRPEIDWSDHSLTVQKCANYVESQVKQEETIKMFGIEYYGECWYGIDDPYMTRYLTPTKQCLSGVGVQHTIMLYRFEKKRISHL